MNDPIVLVVLASEKNIAQNERTYEHLGTGYIASYLRAHGHSVTIYDQSLLQLHLDALIEQVSHCAPELIGVACYQDAYTDLLTFVRKMKYKHPHTHICMGGVFATNSYQHIFQDLPELDSVILGDGEITFGLLADAVLAKKDWQTIPYLTYPNDPFYSEKHPKYDTDLEALPDPARDTLPLVLQQHLFPILSASRGCYGNCSYCSITIQNRQRRCRKITSVVDEMERLRAEYRTRYFYFIDDTFIGRTAEDVQRVEDFARELTLRKMNVQFSIECRANEVNPDLMKMLKEVGLYTVFLGLESGYQPTLNRLRKGMRVEQNLQAIQVLTDLQIRYSIGFIMFHPHTTLEEVAANLEFLQHVEQKNFLDCLHRRLMVFDHAPISEHLRKDGIVCEPWYSTMVPFLYAEIEPLYQFIEQFSGEIKPGINQLAVYYSQTDNEKHKQEIARLHGTLCSTFVNSVYQYTQDPNPGQLDETMHHLQKEYRSTLSNLQIQL